MLQKLLNILEVVKLQNMEELQEANQFMKQGFHLVIIYSPLHMHHRIIIRWVQTLQITDPLCILAESMAKDINLQFIKQAFLLQFINLEMME